MNVTFMKNRSEEIVVNKDVSTVTTRTGSLKEGADVLNPVIMFHDADDYIFSSNYAYIPEFKRYYYVTGITNIRENLWAVSFHVDVLYTYKGSILAQKAVIARQEESYNLYLNDDKFKVYQNPHMIQELFPTPLPAAKFILSVAGASPWYPPSE